MTVIILFLDVPDQPGPVEVTQRSNTSVFVSWEAGNENNSPTELFIIYINSYKGLEDPRNTGQWRILKFVTPGYRTTHVDLKPWTSYTFRVKQLNGIGYSDLSEPSPTYTTAASRPYSNPENIRAESTNSSVINVYWKVQYVGMLLCT